MSYLAEESTTQSVKVIMRQSTNSVWTSLIWKGKKKRSYIERLGSPFVIYFNTKIIFFYLISYC